MLAPRMPVVADPEPHPAPEETCPGQSSASHRAYRRPVPRADHCGAALEGNAVSCQDQEPTVAAGERLCPPIEPAYWLCTWRRLEDTIVVGDEDAAAVRDG